MKTEELLRHGFRTNILMNYTGTYFRIRKMRFFNETINPVIKLKKIQTILISSIESSLEKNWKKLLSKKI